MSEAAGRGIAICNLIPTPFLNKRNDSRDVSFEQTLVSRSLATVECPAFALSVSSARLRQSGCSADF